MNINRAVEDDDENGAKKTLDDAEELLLSAHARRASMRLKLDLEIVRGAGEVESFAAANYPEWDYNRKRPPLAIA